MKYILIGVTLLLLFGIISIPYFTKNKPPVTKNSPNITAVQKTKIFEPFTASFYIKTNNTKRIFTDPKYHFRSEQVYITPDDPSLIYIKSENITWNDFFKTLPPPMKVTKNCIVTGTGQSFCTNNKFSLQFFLNGELSPNALDTLIKPNQLLEIFYE